MAKASKAKSVITWEEFLRKADEWNEDDNSLIESVKEETYQKIGSIQGTHRPIAHPTRVPDGKRNVRKYDKAFLFIGAHVEAVLQSGMGALKLTEDVAREQLISEFKNYFRFHPDLTEFHFPSPNEFNPNSNPHFCYQYDVDKTRYMLQLCSVYAYDDMKAVVKDFMEKHGSIAAVAHVYFNGHGAELKDMKSQLVFKQPMKSNQNLNTIIADMTGIFNESIKSGILEKSHLLFCQCHAYQHKKTKGDQMYIAHFTSCDHKATNFELVPGELRCDEILTVLDSHHVELEQYAQKLDQYMHDINRL